MANRSPAGAEANRRAIARWHEENTEVISIRVRKGRRDAYKALAERTGKSVTGMIVEHLDALCEEHGIT